MTGDERTALSHWFPAVQKVLPTERYPKTILVAPPKGCRLLRLLDGDEPTGLDEFEERLAEAAETIGYPVFLRSDLTSAKHEPGPPCVVRGEKALLRSVSDIVDYQVQNLITPIGLDCWAVREMLPITPAFYAFGGLPIVPEVRLIVRGGRFERSFPYWPAAALEETARRVNGDPMSGGRFTLAMAAMKLAANNAKDLRQMREMSEAVCTELDGDWSIDWMKTDRGWVLIDMADADLSWVPEMDTQQ
jgi:hypothetical protein